MAMKNGIILPAVVTLVVFLLSASLAVSYEIEDPELTRCMAECHSQPHYDIGMIRRCEELCQKEHQQRISEQQERGSSGESEWTEKKTQQEKSRVELAVAVNTNRQSDQDREEPAEQRFRDCRSRCRQQYTERGKQCMTRCEERYREEKRHGEGESPQRRYEEGDKGVEEMSERERLVSYEREDPELTQCMQMCHAQRHFDPARLRKCEERCRKEYPQKESEQHEEHGSGESQNKEDPEQRFRECRLRCRQQHEERRQQSRCMTKCEERYRKERSQGGGNPHRRYEEEEEERKRENPYVFGKERFRYEHRTDRGFVKVLDRFHEKSELLSGLANYTIGVLVAEPHTFVMPTHFDADCVCYVFKGRGTLTILSKGEKKSHEIREGDVFVTSAGSIIYMVSSDPRERLVVVKFLRSVNLPGQVMHFHVAGGQNPESIYRHFSEEILEAAFRAPIDQVENVFGRQQKGAFIRASQEQIQGLRRHSKEGGSWPFGESRGPFNLLRKQATHSNRYGALFEADSRDYQQLQHLNVRVSLANITDGSMMAPFYNSRSTKVAMVVQGSGYIEIIFPHLARKTQRGHGTHRRTGQEEEEGRGRQRYREEEEEYEGRGMQGQQRYKKIRAYLSQGMVFVVPAGHPVVEVASPDQNLQTICFEICADRNERIFLAGRNNILNKMEREAKELAFDTRAQEVDQVLNAQREEAFFPGPGSRRQQRDEEGSRPQTIVESLLNAADGF